MIGDLGGPVSAAVLVVDYVPAHVDDHLVQGVAVGVHAHRGDAGVALGHLLRRFGNALKGGGELRNASGVKHGLVVIDNRGGAVKGHGPHILVHGVEVHFLLQQITVVKAVLLNKVADRGDHAGVDHGLQVLLADLDDMGAAVPVGHVEKLAGGFIVGALVGGYHFILVLALVEPGYQGVQGLLGVAAHRVPELNLHLAAVGRGTPRLRGAAGSAACKRRDQCHGAYSKGSNSFSKVFHTLHSPIVSFFIATRQKGT